MLQKGLNCTIPKKISRKHAPNPPSYATPRKPPPPPKKKNSWPPLANPANAHELPLRNLFENPPWQTIDCVHYVICLCITKSF